MSERGGGGKGVARIKRNIRKSRSIKWIEAWAGRSHTHIYTYRAHWRLVACLNGNRRIGLANLYLCMKRSNADNNDVFYFRWRQGANFQKNTKPNSNNYNRKLRQNTYQDRTTAIIACSGMWTGFGVCRTTKTLQIKYAKNTQTHAARNDHERNKH